VTRKQSPETSIQQPDGNHRKVLNCALRILTGRDHSEFELNRKLRKRGFDPEDIGKAVSECVRFNYINDERTSRVYINQMVRKGYGLNRIRHELNKKGLKGKGIQQILSEKITDVDEQDNAERVLKKNIKRFERERDPMKRKDKIFRFLYGRGFSRETIIKVMENVSRDGHN
jgi:regulatory protein